jgi:hypothetical protein
MSYLPTHNFSVFYLLNIELSKKELVQQQARKSKNQEKRGTAKNLFAKAPENTRAWCYLHITHNRSVQYCGCGCISDVACLPVITACVLDNSKRERQREREREK